MEYPASGYSAFGHHWYFWKQAPSGTVTAEVLWGSYTIYPTEHVTYHTNHAEVIHPTDCKPEFARRCVIGLWSVEVASCTTNFAMPCYWREAVADGCHAHRFLRQLYWLKSPPAMFKMSTEVVELDSVPQGTSYCWGEYFFQHYSVVWWLRIRQLPRESFQEKVQVIPASLAVKLHPRVWRVCLTEYLWDKRVLNNIFKMALSLC